MRKVRLVYAFLVQINKSSPKILFDDENVTKAEMIQSLHVVDTNQSFSSYSFDSERFQRMIPHSIIAKDTNNQKQKLNIQLSLE